jgi:DNA-directed RNA polymerase specialized sigma24 family protein
MLTGDQAAAEDLLQTALARTWPHWGRIADGRPDAYVRKVMVRVNAGWRARRWTQETPTADADLHPRRHHGSGSDDPARLDDRLMLLTSQSAKGLVKLRQALEATEPDRTSTR